MIRRGIVACTMVCVGVLLVAFVISAAADVGLSLEEQLGRSIFFDENLSINLNQSCATCHDPDWGFSGPDSVVNAGGAVYEG